MDWVGGARARAGGRVKPLRDRSVEIGCRLFLVDEIQDSTSRKRNRAKGVTRRLRLQLPTDLTQFTKPVTAPRNHNLTSSQGLRVTLESLSLKIGGQHVVAGMIAWRARDTYVFCLACKTDDDTLILQSVEKARVWRRLLVLPYFEARKDRKAQK